MAQRFEQRSKRYLQGSCAVQAHDRVQVRPGAMSTTAGADAGRARRHRTRHHACGLAAPRRARAAAVLCARRPEIPGAARRAHRPRRADRGRRRRRGARGVRARAAGRRPRRRRSPPSRASPDRQRAGRASPRSTAPSPTWSPARPRAIVTNPVAKNVLYRSGFADPGHTEYLAKLAEDITGVPAWPVMMLWSPELAVVPVTIHLPLKDVIAQLTRDLIFETGRIVARDLRDRFGIARPRLAVAGPQSACRRGRHARRRGPDRGAAGDRAADRRRHRCARPAAGRLHVPRGRRARPTTPRSACITTRR